MPLKTDELRTQPLGPMPTPAELGSAHPITDEVAQRIAQSRRQIENILTGEDQRLLVIVGPCSVHDTEAAIDYRLSRDLYVVLGDQQSDNSWTIRTYLKPFTNWIWGGCALMAVGGLLSLTDRRLRIAAGRRKVTVVEQST